MSFNKVLQLASAASLASLASVPGARAADLPARQAAPIEYVRICDAYGAGFFFIPGTDSCLKVGGMVLTELRGFDPSFSISGTNFYANGTPHPGAGFVPSVNQYSNARSRDAFSFAGGTTDQYVLIGEPVPGCRWVVGLNGPHLDGVIWPDNGDAARRDGGDLKKRALVGGHRPIAQEPGDRRLVDSRARGELRQRPYLGREGEAAIGQEAPVKRLDAIWVAGQIEAVFQGVHHRDGEHAAQFG